MDQFTSADHVALSRAPDEPVICHRPHAATRSSAWFTSRFPGTVLYAVKANPEPIILDGVAAGGVNHFDVASLKEIRSVRRRFPNATLAFMHPVKSRESIREAYLDHGVRIFSLDSHAELDKILMETGWATDLTLSVRLTVQNDHAVMSLSKKFGIGGLAAVDLLQKTRQVAERLGISFHVGSQTMVPHSYADAMDHVQQLIVESGVFVDVVDIGGGFPASYPGMEPPAIESYVQEIERRFDTFLSSGRAELWCEPGRALSAEATSLLVRVEGRRGRDLYLNDGTYGVLFDAGHFAWRYPVRAIGKSGAQSEFSFYGPTCDDADFMPGPFVLPSTMAEGDYIEIGMVGAYGRTMATQFNGYGSYIDVTCTDDPFGTVYLPAEDQVRWENWS